MLGDCARDAGLSRHDFLKGLDDPQYLNALLARAVAGLEDRVFGVPLFVVDGERFWGNDRLLEGREELTQYLFNTRKNQHYFCRRCGVRAFGVGNETPMGKMYGVNLGCLEDVSEEELARVPITSVDGRSDSPEAPGFFRHL